MDYTEDKEYQYTRVDGSIYTLEDPFPDITETYWGNTELVWNPEDKISWDELAPSLQELILAKLRAEEANIELDSLSSEIQNELAKIAILEFNLLIETTERQESDKALDDKITQIINFESRLDHVENEIENIYENLAEIREEINDILEEISKIKERLDELEDRMDEAEDQIRKLWQEIWYIWGSTETTFVAGSEPTGTTEYLRYHPKKHWTIPFIWFDFWFLWGRDTTYKVYRQTPLAETEYEADYTAHKKQKWNIPHIWDELWWIWGGNNAATTANESANEALFTKYRNHNPSWDLPHVWFDIWFLWSRDTTKKVYKDTPNQEEQYEADYTSHKKEKWNIPHIWDEIWWLWGGVKTPAADNESSNNSSFILYRNHNNVLSSALSSDAWNIPHIWFDIWFLWTRSVPTEVYITGTDNSSIASSLALAGTKERNYLKHRVEKWNIPHIWDELWYLWGGELEASDDNETNNENSFIKYRWRYRDGESGHRAQWNIPHIWYDVWYLWARTNYDDPEENEDELENEYNDFKFHYGDPTKPNAWNIPHIWDEIWWVWTEYPDVPQTDIDKQTDFEDWRNKVSVATEKYMTIPNIWKDIWFIWGDGTEDNYARNRKERWNIPHIWYDFWWLWARGAFSFQANEQVEEEIEKDYIQHKFHYTFGEGETIDEAYAAVSKHLNTWNIPHIWDDIWHIWGGNVEFPTNENEPANEALYLKYKYHRYYPSGQILAEYVPWDIPHIWFDIWFLWSRDTTYKVFTDDPDDPTNREVDYETDYRKHKLQKHNIPHIWDELWYLWGGELDPTETNETSNENKLTTNRWRYLSTNGSKAHWNIPRIWYDIWFLWSRTEYTYGSSEALNETNYSGHRQNYWNIPHIWDEIWWVWGIPSSDSITLAQEIANMTLLGQAKEKYKPIPDIWKSIWYTWSGTWDEDQAKLSYNSNTAVGRAFIWAIPNIWTEIAYMWGANSNTAFNESTEYRSNHTRRDIPSIWAEFRYLWGASADAGYESSTYRAAYSTRNIPSIWHAIDVGIWGNNTTMQNSNNDNNYNIPKIWQAIWNTWSKTGSESDYTSYAALSNHKNIPYIWDEIDTIYEEIDHIWGNDNYKEHYNDYNINAIWDNFANYLTIEAYNTDQQDLWGSYYSVRNNKTKNIEKLWEEIDSLSDTYLTIAAYDTDQQDLWGNYYSVRNSKTKNIEKIWDAIDEINTDIDNIWGSSSTKSDHSTKNITKVWDAIDECKSRLDIVEADIEILRKTTIGLLSVISYQWNDNIIQGGSSNLPHHFAMYLSSRFTVSSVEKNKLIFDICYKFEFGGYPPVNTASNNPLYIPLFIPCTVTYLDEDHRDVTVFSFGSDRTIGYMDPSTNMFVYYPLSILKSGELYNPSSSSNVISHALIRDNGGVGAEYPDHPIMKVEVSNLPGNVRGGFELTVDNLEVLLDTEISGYNVDSFIQNPGLFIKNHLKNKNTRAFATQEDADYFAEMIYSQMINT